MNKYVFFSWIIMQAITSSLWAQIPSMKTAGKSGNQDVYLESLDIQVDVTGNIAATKFLMTFKNRTNRILEGELTFPLPEGITVSSYALDINGKMREAVPVEKAKATQVFEEIEQRQIDPGLLERVEGNNFRTRIYPIPANGVRTISIGYEEELSIKNGAYQYKLPMDYQSPIDRFSIKATVWQTKEKPKVSRQSSNEIVFDKAGNNYVSSFSRNNYKPSDLLEFSLPVQKNTPLVIMQSASGSYYFLASCVLPEAVRKKEWKNHIGIIWDNSLSGLKRNTEKELELLDILFQENKNMSVSVFFLNNRFSKEERFSAKNGNWEDLRKRLETVIYDGGTNYEQIILPASISEYLFFSDGLSTLSNAELSRPNETTIIHTIVSSSKADYSSSKWIARQNSGKFFNLNTLSPEEIRKEIRYESFHFLGIEKPQSVREVYPSIATPVSEKFSVAGILDENTAQIVLKFGYGTTVEKRIKINLKSAEASQQGNVHRIWAQKKINELDMLYERNKEELTELGQEFGIVTRNTSLMVLETLQDYITYNITPPAELLDEYVRWKKNRDSDNQRKQESLLADAIYAAKDLKEWWNTDFKPKKNKYPKPDAGNQIPPPPFPDENMEISVVTFEDEASYSVDIAELQKIKVAEQEERVEPFFIGGALQRQVAEKDEDVRKEQASTSATTSRATIRIIPKLNQDKEYIQKLTGKADADYAIYLAIREDYLHTPNFYFDMADWFYRLGDKEKALRILTSIAEIDIENASLYRLLGYRLKEYKEYEMEAFICKKVIQWRPMEPQSYRDYALALEDAGKSQDALEALYSVLTQSYASNIGNRSAGIEEVVVSELNKLISSNKKIDQSTINEELIGEMPVDIRVVINWNMNSTDIDLHVIDPNKEECFYGHSRTDIGGRISNDITQGYGPEQFMLKKAIPGKYEVFVNYFGDSQVKPEGPSTIMLEIFTNYSTGKQKREVVCVQLSKEKERTEDGKLKIAEFEF